MKLCAALRRPKVILENSMKPNRELSPPYECPLPASVSDKLEQEAKKNF